MSLVVKQSDIKTTKSNKPYLSMVLTDGKQDIVSNIWDWYQDNYPKINTVLRLTANVGEFNGNLQLNISYFTVDHETPLSNFMPREDFDINAYFQQALYLTSEIKDNDLALIVLHLFENYEALWKLQPGAKKVHHAVVAGNLKHCVDVAYKVRALASLIPDCNQDLALAGALIHDVGKLFTYKFEGIVIDFSLEGNLLDHIVLGMREVEKLRTESNSSRIDLLQHIIASHHGKLEAGSPVTPRCIEAVLVHFCDDIDAKAQIFKELNANTKNDAEYTARSFALDNRIMVSRGNILRLLNLVEEQDAD